MEDNETNDENVGARGKRALQDSSSAGNNIAKKTHARIDSHDIVQQPGSSGDDVFGPSQNASTGEGTETTESARPRMLFPPITEEGASRRQSLALAAGEESADDSQPAPTSEEPDMTEERRSEMPVSPAAEEGASQRKSLEPVAGDGSSSTSRDTPLAEATEATERQRSKMPITPTTDENASGGQSLEVAAGECTSSASRTAVPSEETSTTERQRSKMPITLTREEAMALRDHNLTVSANQRIAVTNKQRNKAGDGAISKSAAFLNQVYGLGDTHRRWSWESPLKSLASLTNSIRPRNAGPQVESSAASRSPLRRLLKLTGARVNFREEVRVKQLELNPGGPPEVVQQIPVAAEEIREQGKLLDKAQQAAADAARAKARKERAEAEEKRRKQAHQAHFDNRLENGPLTSPVRSGPRPSGPVIVDRVIDELDRLRLSRGELTTMQERRVSTDSEGDDELDPVDLLTDQETSAMSSTDGDPSVVQADQTLEESSKSQRSGTSDTQAGRASGSASDAGSNFVTRMNPESSSNQENLPPANQAGPSNSVRNRRFTTSRLASGDQPSIDAVITEDTQESKAKTSNDGPPPDYTVRAQIRITYDQDPSIAIQSLSRGLGLLGSIFPFQGQSRQCEQRVESEENATTQYDVFSWKYIIDCLDELGNDLCPDLSDFASCHEAQRSTDCSEDEQAANHEGFVSEAQILTDEETFPCNFHTPLQELVGSGWKERRRLYCHSPDFFGQSSLQTEKMDFVQLPSPALSLSDELPNEGESLPLAYEQSPVSDMGVGVHVTSEGQGHGDDDFGIALERAYISSCSMKGPLERLGPLTPLSAVRNSSTQPLGSQTALPAGTNTKGVSLYREEHDLDGAPRSPARESERPSSRLSASSRCSIVTAFNDSEIATCKDSEYSTSSLSDSEKNLIENRNRSDSGCGKLDETTGEMPHVSDIDEDTRPDSPETLLQKRSGSGSTSSSALSIITTFTTHSKDSGDSKTSLHSSGSSGSSGSSSLRFARCGNSQRWTPITSKSQASVCMDKDFERRGVDPLRDATEKSPAPCSNRTGPSAEDMRKFVMKYPTTQPRKSAKKLEVRRVAQKRAPVAHLWTPGRDEEDVSDGEIIRYKVFNRSGEAEEQSALGNCPLSPMDGSDESSSSGSVSSDEED